MRSAPILRRDLDDAHLRHPIPNRPVTGTPTDVDETTRYGLPELAGTATHGLRTRSTAPVSQDGRARAEAPQLRVDGATRVTRLAAWRPGTFGSGRCAEGRAIVVTTGDLAMLNNVPGRPGLRPTGEGTTGRRMADDH